MLDNINPCLAYTRKKYPDLPLSQDVNFYYCNTVQSVARLPVTYGLPTPATSTAWDSYEIDVIITGKATLRCLGWPRYPFI